MSIYLDGLKKKKKKKRREEKRKKFITYKGKHSVKGHEYT